MSTFESNMQYLMTKDGYAFEVLEWEQECVFNGRTMHTFRCYALDGSFNWFIQDKTPCFEIEKVIYNDPATIVFWADGTKTVVKCGEEDIYDYQTGLLMCIAKKAYGNKGSFNDILREWMPEEVNPVENATNAFEAFAKLLNATLVTEVKTDA